MGKCPALRTLMLTAYVQHCFLKWLLLGDGHGKRGTQDSTNPGIP